MTVVWVDADSCPRMVREYLVSYTKKLEIPVIFVANRIIPQPVSYEKFKMVVCPSESQAADDYIAEHVNKSDLVVTRDIPLADRLVETGISVMNDRGTLFTAENIKERLSERNFNLQLAEIGLCGTKQSYYGKKEFALFANCFDKKIHQLIKEN